MEGGKDRGYEDSSISGHEEFTETEDNQYSESQDIQGKAQLCLTLSICIEKRLLAGGRAGD